MSMGLHHPYHLDLCADDEDPSQLIIRPGWDAPHVRCFPRAFFAWPCLLRQVGTALGSLHMIVLKRDLHTLTPHPDRLGIRAGLTVGLSAFVEVESSPL